MCMYFIESLTLQSYLAKLTRTLAAVPLPGFGKFICTNVLSVTVTRKRSVLVY